MPQLYFPEPQKLRHLIWSRKYASQVGNKEFLSSLTKSYSQLPLILGGQHREHLIIPAKVDEALEHLMETFLRLYVCSWYVGKVSEKHDFIEQVKHELASILRSFYEILLELDLGMVVGRKIAPICLKHFLIAKENLKHGTKVCKGRFREKFYDTDFSRVLMSCYSNLDQVHPAVKSREAEIAYLEALCDCLLPLLCHKDLLTIDCSRTFLRETVASKLLFLVDYLSTPATVNKLLFLWASPGRKYSDNVSNWCHLLADYGWRKPRTVPLLCFSLQEVRPEKGMSVSQFHSRILYEFQQFLRRRGPKYFDIYMLYQELCMFSLPQSEFFLYLVY